MPTAIKSDVLIESDKGGFTETLYSNSEETLAQRLDKLSTYAGVRSQLLGPDFEIKELRVSEVNTLNDSLVIVSPSYQEAFGGFGSAHPDSAILCRYQGTALYYVPAHLRGLPWNIYLPLDGTIPVHARFIPRLQALRTHLQAAGNGWRVRTLSREDADLPFEALTIGTDPAWGDTATKITPSLRDFNTGDKLRLSLRTKQYGAFAQHYRGIWRVILQDADRIIINAPFPTGFVYKDKGLVIPQRLTYTQIASVQPERMVRRKAGQDFSTSKGRRTKKAVV